MAGVASVPASVLLAVNTRKTNMLRLIRICSSKHASDIPAAATKSFYECEKSKICISQPVGHALFVTRSPSALINNAPKSLPIQQLRHLI